jgi:putative copper resistance protein D
MTAALALVRWAHLLPLMAVFGAASFASALRRKKVIVTAVALPWFGWACLIALLTAIVQLLLTTAAMSGDWQGALDPAALRSVVVDTTFGNLAIVRLAALALLCLTVVLRRPAGWEGELLSAVALLGLAFTSHAAASGSADHAMTRALNDAVHLVTAGFWIGGLLLLLQLAQQRRSPDLMPALQLFSQIAIYSVTALMLAGMLNTLFVYSAQRVSWTYTILLIVKVALALGMITFAFINRLRVMPALEQGHDDGTLAKNVRSELTIGAVVVGIAAILGSISPS